MSRIKIVAAVSCAGLIAMVTACQHPIYGGFDVGQTPAPAPAPAPLAGYALRFSDDGANAKLTYAQTHPGGDDEDAGEVGLMLECEHGSGAIHLTGPAPAIKTPTMTLASDLGRSQVKTERQIFDGRALLLGETTADSPALAGFRRSGRLTVGVGERSYLVQADAGATPSPVTRFFVACERRAG